MIDPGLVQALLAAAIIILVAFPVHEFSHAWMADRLGDATARWQGRLTLDPRVHFDPIGGIVLIATVVLRTGFFIGWAKPTPVNPYNLRGGRRGEAFVALAGPISNLVMAIAVAIPLRLAVADPGVLETIATNDVADFVFGVAVFFVVINVLLFVFNFLPIPPLDGWRMLLGLVDARLAHSLRQYEQYGLIVLLLFILVGGRYLGDLISFVVRLLLPFAA
ncbi:MAG TPA: site-2 protease family protein [Candidatus Limnocylindria bacterium]|nr:site-2 protease family protein [Candidatus Limnocylindria bacterium]